MIINSSDRRHSLELLRHDTLEGAYRTSVFTATGTLEGRRVSVSGVVLPKPENFQGALEAFGRTRTGSATLEGAGGFRMTIEPDGDAGAARVNFTITDKYSTGTSPTGHAQWAAASLSGGFSVDGEWIGTLVADMNALLRGGQAV